MADDIKLQVGLDLDALKTSAERGASVLGQAFQGAMSSLLSGQTLGSGVPPTQIAPGQGHMEQMLDALEGIQQTLQAGLSALIQGIGGGGGIGGATGPSGSGRPMYSPPQNAGGGSGGSKPTTFGGELMEGARTLDRFPMSSFANMIQTDFGRTGIYQFANQLLGNVPIVGKLFGLGAEYSQASDEFLNQSTNVFRAGGRDARRNFRMTGGMEAGHEFLKQNGITLPEYANMQMQAASYGSSVADPLAAIQGRYGLADKGVDLMRTMVQGGGTLNSKGVNDVNYKAGEHEWRNFADVLAVAIGTNLDRGRWGEAFTALSGAARRITTGNIDREGLLSTEQFVGNMGARFQGDSAAHQSMVTTLQGLQGGQGGGLASLMALQAGGLGSGGGFFDAQARVDLGAAAGGVGLGDVLNRYKNLGFVQAYMTSGDEKDLNRAYIILSRMLPAYKPTDIKEMLRAMRGGGPKPLDETLRNVMGRTIGSPMALGGDKPADFLPKQEGEVLGSAVAGSFKGADFTANMDQEEQRAAGRGQGIGGIENADEARAQGGFRRNPAVEMVDNPTGNTEGFGDQRSYWPMGPGDQQESGFLPGWRKARATDPHGARHMARDIVIGNGSPGQRVHAPVHGIWLTQSPVLAIAGSPDEGYCAEMLGDNETRYKFVHLHFDQTLKKGVRVRQGQFIGTVAKNTKNSVPHLHLEARKRVNGKTQVVDPMSTMGAQDRDIMTGKMPDPGVDAGTAPERLQPGQNIDPTSGEQLKTIKPEDVVPLSMNNQRMDVHVFVHDTRVTVSRRPVKSGAPGQLFNKKGIG